MLLTNLLLWLMVRIYSGISQDKDVRLNEKITDDNSHKSLGFVLR